MSAANDFSQFRSRSYRMNVAELEGDIRVESASDRKAELRRQLLIALLADSSRDSKHYVKNYTVGRGAE